MAADEEAVELHEVAASDEALERLIARRCAGEPLAWIVGTTRFCGESVLVDQGVFVPRWQSETLAETAVARLPPAGVAVDLCTGSGAVALTMKKGRPLARVFATDVDERAVHCARRNGVDALLGHLGAPLPPSIAGRVDVVTAIAPYVPTDQLDALPRDVREWEPLAVLDGGADGLRLVNEVIVEAARLLKRGGTLLLEFGVDQLDLVTSRLSAVGFVEAVALYDGDGDFRGVSVTFAGVGR